MTIAIIDHFLKVRHRLTFPANLSAQNLAGAVVLLVVVAKVLFGTPVAAGAEAGLLLVAVGTNMCYISCTIAIASGRYIAINAVIIASSRGVRLRYVGGRQLRGVCG